MKASLVMRDRETDSWWSIMTSDAIGGDLDGTHLVELPVSEKTTWADWSGRHPDTLVLSIDGSEHVSENRYDNYLASEETFRNLEIDDDRLPPKEAIYTFFLDETPYAAPQSAFEGGKLFRLDDGRGVYIYRKPGISSFASSRAWVIEGAELESAADLLAALEAGTAPGAREIGGFDTFWYSWVAVNSETELLQ